MANGASLVSLESPGNAALILPADHFFGCSLFYIRKERKRDKRRFQCKTEGEGERERKGFLTKEKPKKEKEKEVLEVKKEKNFVFGRKRQPIKNVPRVWRLISSTKPGGVHGRSRGG